MPARTGAGNKALQIEDVLVIYNNSYAFRWVVAKRGYLAHETPLDRWVELHALYQLSAQRLGQARCRQTMFKIKAKQETEEMTVRCAECGVW